MDEEGIWSEMKCLLGQTAPNETNLQKNIRFHF